VRKSANYDDCIYVYGTITAQQGTKYPLSCAGFGRALIIVPRWDLFGFIAGIVP